jgi:two-component system response regulator YesN
LGISLVSYLNTIKIKEACKLIKSGCTNMTQVAIQSGFNSSSYFCKVFKKEKGISPTEFRKAIKLNVML